MGAPQVRLSELGRELIDLGWDVEALTALPNYPTGKVFRGYDRTRPCVEQLGKIRVVRVPLYTTQTGFVRRLRSYFSFVSSAKRHGLRLCRPPDLLYVESPPLFIGYAAKYLAKRWRCPYVFNVSDLWPESALRMGILRLGILYSAAERLELSLYRNAAGVTGQSSEIIHSIRLRCPGIQSAIITNGVSPDRFGKHLVDLEARTLLGTEPGPIFVYAGLLGIAQGLDQILDMAQKLPQDVPGRFVLIGDGPNRQSLEHRIESETIPRVRILPEQPRERIPALLAGADVAIISLGVSIPGAVPSKMYEAMASALPVLLIADGEAARRIHRAECGVTVRPRDLDRAIAAFGRLATDPQLRARLGRNGRRAAETIYNRQSIARRLDQFLRGSLTRKVGD